MEIKQLVLLFFVLIVIIYLIVNTFSSTTHLTKMAKAKEVQTISSETLKNKSNSSNYTYSMWMYIDDWNYRFGEDKIVLDRKKGPTVVLGDKPNTLKVLVKYYSDPSDLNANKIKSDDSWKDLDATNAACDACNSGFSCACNDCQKGIPKKNNNNNNDTDRLKTPDEYFSDDANSTDHQCLVENIPIQKWVNIIVSVYGRTLDIYLNGKLVRTCVIPGVPKVDNNLNLDITPNGGFSGWTSSFKYWSKSSNPQQAYNIYKDGFGGSILGNALSKYRLRFSMIKDNEVKSSFEI